MEGDGILAVPFIGIHGPEAGTVGFEVARTEEIHAEVRIELLAAVEIGVLRGAGFADEQTKRIIVIGIGDGSGLIGEESDIPVAIVAIMVRLPGIENNIEPLLTDKVEAVGIDGMDK